MADIMVEKKKFIRDSVYGDISLNEFEVRIMDMPQFQRLRCIKQLGLISLIYPGATHTRFEHCIGAMHLGSKLSEELDLDEDKLELIRASALLHDIGHGPFSHVSEGVLSVPHEELSKFVITETSMRDLLEEKFDVNEIVDIINGKVTEAQLHNASESDLLQLTENRQVIVLNKRHGQNVALARHFNNVPFGPGWYYGLSGIKITSGECID